MDLPVWRRSTEPPEELRMESLKRRGLDRVLSLLVLLLPFSLEKPIDFNIFRVKLKKLHLLYVRSKKSYDDFYELPCRCWYLFAALALSA